MRSSTFLLKHVGLAVSAWCLAAVAHAAPDDTERPLNADAPQQQVHIAPENFEQWVFQGAQNEQTARQQMTARLKLQLTALDRKYEFSDEQKRKLQLAGDGDMARFFKEVDVVRQQFRKQMHDQNALGEIWPQIQPLQVKMTTGLFGERSLFKKVLHHTLDEEQNAELRATALARQKFRYRAAVECSVAMLEDAVPLENRQRQALIELLLKKTNPPATFGQYDYYYVLYQLSMLAENEVTEHLNDGQRAQMKVQLQQGRGMQQMLRQNGALDVEGVR